MGKAKAAPAAASDGTAKLAGTAYHAASRSVAAREQALQAAGRLCENGEKWAKRIGARQSRYEFIELWWSLPASVRATPPPQSTTSADEPLLYIRRAQRRATRAETLDIVDRRLRSMLLAPPRVGVADRRPRQRPNS